MDTKEGKVTASLGVLTHYNMLLTEAIYELLADKGIVSKEEILERVRIPPDAPRRSVRITQSPFLIGRGGGTGNQLQLSDARISRSAAAICFDGGHYLEDRGQRGGMFLNGKKIAKHVLEDGDVITFGVDGSYQIVFRQSASTATVDHLLSRIENITRGDSSPGIRSRVFAWRQSS